MPDKNAAPALKITSTQSMGPERTYPLLPDDFRNELFDDNIAYFKEHQPGIYDAVKDYRCTDYRLCINPDGSPNIMHMAEKNLLYYSEGEMNINRVKDELASIPYAMEVSPAYTMTFKPDWYERNPITTRMYQRMFDLGPIKILAEDNSRQQFSDTFEYNFFPYLRVYGVGLGYHITQLIQSKNVLSIFIYEPEMDLFYTSLFTMSWRLLFKYMEVDPARRLSLIVDAKPNEAIEAEKEFLSQNFPFIHAARWRLQMFKSPAIEEFIELEQNAYYILGENLTAGWYEDQRAGLVNYIGNLIARKKVFVKNKVFSHLRIAVVGGGPSLDDSIAYLKKHAKEFVIFACGTSITPLLKNGIIPDYHIHQERRSDADSVISWAGKDAYQKMTALKLNVMGVGIDELYKDSYIFQKYNDPASALLGERFPVTKHVNPTVTNSAIAFAAQLEANEVYLFGVDYGAGSDRKAMHAAHYIHADRPTEKVDQSSHYRLKGNFGNTVISTGKLVQSHNEAEVAIAIHPGTRWYNVGDGAFIKNTKPVKVKALPVQFKKRVDKARLKQEIAKCFDNNYSVEAVIDNLEQHHGKVISEYFSAIRNFRDVSPTTRSMIVNTLALIYQAVDVGKGVNRFMPHKLFSGAMKRFIENAYIQNTLFSNDAEAVEFYHSAMQVFDQYIDDLQSDMVEIIANARYQLDASETQSEP